MPGEYDPAEELGLFPDRILVTNLCGFVLQNDPLRDVCARFIRNGAHFYDVVKRYDHLTAYVLGREEATAGNSLKFSAISPPYPCGVCLRRYCAGAAP